MSYQSQASPNSGEERPQGFPEIIETAVRQNRLALMRKTKLDGYRDPLSALALEGRCGLAQADIAFRIADLTKKAKLEVEVILHQSEKIFGGWPHVFLAVVYGDNVWLVDTTFIQFFAWDQRGSHPLVYCIGMLSANRQERSSLGYILELLQNGYLELNDTVARLYAGLLAGRWPFAKNFSAADFRHPSINKPYYSFKELSDELLSGLDGRTFGVEAIAELDKAIQTACHDELVRALLPQVLKVEVVPIRPTSPMDSVGSFVFPGKKAFSSSATRSQECLQRSSPARVAWYQHERLFAPEFRAVKPQKNGAGRLGTERIDAFIRFIWPNPQEVKEQKRQIEELRYFLKVLGISVIDGFYYGPAERSGYPHGCKIVSQKVKKALQDNSCGFGYELRYAQSRELEEVFGMAEHYYLFFIVAGRRLVYDPTADQLARVDEDDYERISPVLMPEELAADAQMYPMYQGEVVFASSSPAALATLEPTKIILEVDARAIGRRLSQIDEADLDWAYGIFIFEAASSPAQNSASSSALRKDSLAVLIFYLSLLLPSPGYAFSKNKLTPSPTLPTRGREKHVQVKHCLHLFLPPCGGGKGGGISTQSNIQKTKDKVYYLKLLEELIEEFKRFTPKSKGAQEFFDNAQTGLEQYAESVKEASEDYFRNNLFARTSIIIAANNLIILSLQLHFLSLKGPADPAELKEKSLGLLIAAKKRSERLRDSEQTGFLAGLEDAIKDTREDGLIGFLKDHYPILMDNAQENIQPLYQIYQEKPDASSPAQERQKNIYFDQQKVREIMKKEGLTLATLAAEMGVTRPVVSRLLSGVIKKPLELILSRLSRAKRPVTFFLIYLVIRR